jgi:hypothetical protein
MTVHKKFFEYPPLFEFSTEKVLIKLFLSKLVSRSKKPKNGKRPTCKMQERNTRSHKKAAANLIKLSTFGSGYNKLACLSPIFLR